MGGSTKTVLYQILVLECFCILVSVQLNLTHTSSSDDIRSLHQELNTLRRDYNNVLSELANIRKSLGIRSTYLCDIFLCFKKPRVNTY